MHFIQFRNKERACKHWSVRRLNSVVEDVIDSSPCRWSKCQLHVTYIILSNGTWNQHQPECPIVCELPNIASWEFWGQNQCDRACHIIAYHSIAIGIEHLQHELARLLHAEDFRPLVSVESLHLDAGQCLYEWSVALHLLCHPIYDLELQFFGPRDREVRTDHVNEDLMVSLGQLFILAGLIDGGNRCTV